ncbi:MAG TPA: HD domain-containing protein [Spirochaetia bacterium]|nr:HD domain-containing protein [Spirochaetia bacterium]
MSCLDWCKYGQDCVGDTIYANYMRNKAIGVKQKLLEVLQEYFGEDRKRISHAERVLDFAEELLEEGYGEWHIVIPASILHDVGIKSAEEKYGSSAADLQEKEGPPVARDILMKLGFRIEDTDQICEIIAHHHHPGVLDTQNFKTVYDSDCVANMQESAGKRTEEQLKTTIDNVLLTPAGKKLAARRLVERSADIPKSRRTVQ